MTETENIQPLPQRQVTPPSPPDSAYLEQLVEQAAYKIHCAIVEQTGSTHSWTEATRQYRDDLRRGVRRLIDGEIQ